MKRYQDKEQKSLLNCLLIILMFLTSCGHEKPAEQSIAFPNKSWQRYNILNFKFPVTETNRSYDIILELRCNKSFDYDNLPINMVISTPSGEERIREYHVQIKDKNGSFTGAIKGDTCLTRLVLKRKLYCSSKGLMKVEIENLNPKMETEGIFSVNLILIQH
ncbi:MAG: hypothetical protein NTX43_13920 [Bacteroidetes bacterium]|nr:hypothetical protein [Bacteroidota bacterium]